MNILEEIAAYARLRVEKDREAAGLSALREQAEALPGGGDRFYAAAAKPGLSFICEIKKASPSKGLIDPLFDYRGIAREYDAAGADCISCLTEPRWFLGSDGIFREVRGLTDIPMLRKDFVIDEYQIFQAKVLGADCALLICALLPPATLARWVALCESLSLAALVEAHDADEIQMAADAGARMIGVNNRNLKDFSVDLSNAARLRDRIPAGCLYVSESGIGGPDDVAALKDTGADAVLVGEALMRAPDKGAFLAGLRRAAE
ncbi:MAG: indole-3-glycerol phosphate synthase TrpC [Abditibacteriota bacterium]|nr:indole-3-glycerol phosphate synthase TrpC [Abditibacteriota bacterium]